MRDRNTDWKDQRDAAQDPNLMRFAIRKMPALLAKKIERYAARLDIATDQGAIRLLVLGLDSPAPPGGWVPTGNQAKDGAVSFGWGIRSMPRQLFERVRAWGHEHGFPATEAAIRLIAHGLNEAHRQAGAETPRRI